MLCGLPRLFGLGAPQRLHAAAAAAAAAATATHLTGLFSLSLMVGVMAAEAPTNFDHVAENLKGVRQEVAAAAAAAAAAAEEPSAAPTLQLPLVVAVSKFNPPAAVAAAMSAGQQHFGENFVQEIVEKAPQLPSTVQWHFIGHLQTNKVKALLQGVPNLFSVDSLDSQKLAAALQREAAKLSMTVNVLVQVNAGGEQQKGGVLGSTWEETREVALALALLVEEGCPNLVFRGFMTVAPHDRNEARATFKRMRELKAAALSSPQLGSALRSRGEALELSMGMTGDMDLAIAEGSTQVRVGTGIFGPRSSPQNS
ncbi:hypothetical protein Esti_004889 [Eimeria stiedai]